jgi:uncharacterized protein YjbI with pentapeptide repeats
MVDLLMKGVDQWNEWAGTGDFFHPLLAGIDLAWTRLDCVNLAKADLRGARLSGAIMDKANLFLANLGGSEMELVSLRSADCREAGFNGTNLVGANLERADLRQAEFVDANLKGADLRRADLRGARLNRVRLNDADLRGAHLDDAVLADTDLSGAKLTAASLYRADLKNANLTKVRLWKANLVEADLEKAILVGTSLRKSDMSNAAVYGASVWDVDLYSTNQTGLLATSRESSERTTVDRLEVAQFIYLLLNNKTFTDTVNALGNKLVLILGRFTDRKEVLEAIRRELRKYDYLPMVFDFQRPTDRDFTETVKTLAGLSRFIIAEITRPQSVPLEAEATIPDYGIPFVPLIAAGERPFSMFRDLWQKYRDWVLDPLVYESVEQLIGVFKSGVIQPANARLAVLRKRKAEEIVMRYAKDLL